VKDCSVVGSKFWVEMVPLNIVIGLSTNEVSITHLMIDIANSVTPDKVSQVSDSMHVEARILSKIARPESK
jgi:hypothetical protein